MSDKQGEIELSGVADLHSVTALWPTPNPILAMQTHLITEHHWTNFAEK